MIGPHAEDPTIVAAGGMGGVGVTSGSIVGFSAAEWALKGSPTTVPGLLAMDVNRFANTHSHDKVSP
jgi:glycine/D-amino acid oxidase-like deaminating enzyme